MAAKGCEEILRSVEGYSHVLCAVGTGTTFAGLVNGAAPKGISVEGVCVLKGAESMEEEILAMTGHNQNWKMHYQFHGGGYGKVTPEGLYFIDTFAAETGILLDQVYTSKMMLATIELVKQQYFPAGSKLLLIHTGGLLGLLSRYH